MTVDPRRRGRPPEVGIYRDIIGVLGTPPSDLIQGFYDEADIFQRLVGQVFVVAIAIDILKITTKLKKLLVRGLVRIYN